MPHQNPTPNIYVVGPQCTGKTTLVNYLKEITATNHDVGSGRPRIISEIARAVLSKHRFTTDEIRSSPDRSFLLQQLILDAQCEAETEALLQSPWFISDRSGIDPIVYATRYVSVEAARKMQQSPIWFELRGRMATSLVILCEPNPKWLENDGTRLMPSDLEEWKCFYDSFRQLLEANDLRYEVLPSELQEIEARSDFVLSKLREQVCMTRADK